MKLKKMWIIILLFSLFLSFFLVNGKVEADNTRYVIETDNFIINYRAVNKDIAFSVAKISEEIHNNLVPVMKYEPSEKTHIIINDDFDQANGSTNTSYFNRINIYLRHPEIYSGMVGYYENWLKLLITHEYTHVLHLDMNMGEFSKYRKLMGKIPLLSTPNMLQPWWMIEGYTTYLETKYTSGGRGSNDIYPMYIRTALDTDNLYEIDQIHGRYDINNWPPPGEAIYIYGLSLFEYIADEYGEDKLVDISHKFSSNPQAGINNIFEKVLGTGIENVYNKWKSNKQKEIDRKKNEIEKDKITEVKQLTDTGGHNKNIAVSPDKNNFTYVHYGKMFSSLRLYENINQDKSKDNQLLSMINPDGERVSWSENGRKLLYSKLNYHDKSKLNYDLYLYDFKTNKEKRITRGKRAYSPVWKNENSIIYLVQENGNTYIKEKNLVDNNTDTLISADNENIHYSHLSISPDKEKLLISLWNKGKRDIYLLKLADNDLIPLIVDDYINIYPEWGPDGDFIIFSSDREQIFNLYAYNLDNKNLYKITNLFTGAFEAKYLNSEEIIFTGYSENGYDIFTVSGDPDSWKKLDDRTINNEPISNITIEDNVDSTSNSEPSESLDDIYDIEKYNPLSTMTPRYWIPNFSYSMYNEKSRLITGLKTGGIDALEKHHYQVGFLYDSIYPDTQINFDYQYNNENIPLSFLLSFKNEYDREDNEVINDQLYQIGMNYPLIRDVFSSTNLSFNMKYIFQKNINRNMNLKSALGFGTGVSFLNVTGWDQIKNENYISLSLEGEKSLDSSAENDIPLAAELKVNNYLQTNEKNQIASRIMLGNSEIKDYKLDFFKHIRTQNNYQGDNIIIFNLENRYKIHEINQGMGHYPLFYDNLNLYTYYDKALIGDKEQYIDISVWGLEMGLEISQLYGMADSELVFGFNSESQAYFRLGKHF